MPRTTDKSFTEKLHQLWGKKTPKYKPSRLSQGFTLSHYAADVEYSTEGWLEKNKDPLNDNVTQLLIASTESYVQSLFEEAKPSGIHNSRLEKKGLFRTVAQRHKEQLNHLMTQLNSTHPHFVRCIIPNHSKIPKKFDNILVLEQLRCNGVLEGIRIARTGYPNRILFTEFRQRYEVLVHNFPQGYVEGQRACTIILKELHLEPDLYRIGLTKVFFKAGVLAELEEQRESTVMQIISNFQTVARGYLQRKVVKKALLKTKAMEIIAQSFTTYLKLKNDPWWKLQLKMKPLVIAARQTAGQTIRDSKVKSLETAMKKIEEEKEQLFQNHRKTEVEMHRIAEILESERRLALDKDAILQRSQKRETDLEEQLNNVMDDLDKLEVQCEELLESKKKVELQTEVWKSELENGAKLIGVLEDEKGQLKNKIFLLEADLEKVSAQQQNRNDESQKLDQELKFLRSSIHQRDRKIEELEAKLKESTNALESKLKDITYSFDSSKKRVRELVKENQEIRQQLNELYSTSSGYEDMVRKKQSELNGLKADIEKIHNELDIMSSEKSDLEYKRKAVEKELITSQKELSILREDFTRVELQATEARQLLEAKVSEEVKHNQGRKLLDRQLEELTAKLKLQEEAISSQVERHRGEMEAKQAFIKRLTQEKDVLKEAKTKLSESLQEKERLKMELEAAKERSTRVETLSSEIRDLEKKISQSEQSKSEAMNTILELRTNLAESTTYSKTLGEKLTETRQEKEDLNVQISALKEQVEDHKYKQEVFVREKQKLQGSIDALKKQLSDKEFELSKLDAEIQQKSKQMSKLRESIAEEVKAKTEKLSKERDALQANEREYKNNLEEINVKFTTVCKQKEKMARDLEDMSHSLSAEKKTALAAQRVQASLEKQCNELKESFDRERRDRSQSDLLKRKLSAALESTKDQLELKKSQLDIIQKVIPRSSLNQNNTDEVVDLASRLEQSEKARKAAEEARELVESQFRDAKKRWSSNLDRDSVHSVRRRVLQEELFKLENRENISRGNTVGAAGGRTDNESQWQSPAKTKITADGKALSRIIDIAKASNLDAKALEQIEEVIFSVEASKRDLLTVYHDTSKKLVDTKDQLAISEKEQRILESQILNNSTTQIVPSISELSDMKLRLEAEESRNQDLADSARLYKNRSEEYYARLETAETIILKASRAEAFAKSQKAEVENLMAAAVKENKQNEEVVMQLQAKIHSLEAKLEDNAIDLTYAKESKERALRELDQLRKPLIDPEESTIESMRGRYREEIRNLSSELESERLKVNDIMNENQNLVHQLEASLSSKQVKALQDEKSKLQTKLDELEKVNLDSVLAYQDSQKRVGSLLSQVKTLRTMMDDINESRDQIQKEKRTLEQRLSEVSQRFEELAGQVPEANNMHPTRLAEYPKARSPISSVQEELRSVQSLYQQEKQLSEKYKKEKSMLEKDQKSLHLKILDMEAQILGSRAGSSKVLQQKISDLEKQLDDQTSKSLDQSRQIRVHDRAVKDLLNQLSMKDKTVTKLNDELEASEIRIGRLTETIESLQSSETVQSLAARRAEREARQAKEMSLRLEKDLEAWKSRFESIGRR